MDILILALHFTILLAVFLAWVWQSKNLPYRKGKYLINIFINIITFLVATNSLGYVIRFFER